MPDISMCKGVDCKIRDKCYRYLAVPSEYVQSYFVESPYDPKKKTCRYFWEVEPQDRVRKVNDI
jgi:hypothetical protein